MNLISFELRGWRRHPPLLLAGGTFAATAALGFGFGPLAILGAAAIVAMSGPFVLFWRPDAAVLARLPLSGASLYDLGAVGVGRLALVVLAGLLPGAIRFGVVVPALTAVVAAALAAPAAALLAGALLASDRARAAVRDVAQGYEAPPTVFLSLFPAMAAFGVGALTFLQLTQGPLYGAAAVAGAALLFLAGRALAERTLPEALRELTAMQAVRLAHVDLSKARGLERAFGGLAGAGRPIYEKDVALTRRRWPLFSLGHGAAVGCLIAGALGAPLSVIAAGGALVAVSTSLLGATLVRHPTEHVRLLETLYPHATSRRAKRLYVLWRATWPLALGGVAILVRDPALLPAIVLGVSFLAAVLGGWLAVRAGR